MKIEGVSSLIPIEQPKALSDNNQGFSEFLTNAINEVKQLDSDANNKTKQLITGEINDISAVTVAAEKASLSFQLALQVRNKVIDAYQEIMRMSV